VNAAVLVGPALPSARDVFATVRIGGGAAVLIVTRNGEGEGVPRVAEAALTMNDFAVVPLAKIGICSFADVAPRGTVSTLRLRGMKWVRAFADPLMVVSQKDSFLVAGADNWMETSANCPALTEDTGPVIDTEYESSSRIRTVALVVATVQLVGRVSEINTRSVGSRKTSCLADSVRVLEVSPGWKTKTPLGKYGANE
jgi:hypothetical protein